MATARAWQWELEPQIFDMVCDIRERFLAGFYTRSELAFRFKDDPLTGDCLTNFDAPAIERKYGAALVAAWLPVSMQVSLPGGEIDDEGWIEGIPARFWPEDLP